MVGLRTGDIVQIAWMDASQHWEVDIAELPDDLEDPSPTLTWGLVFWLTEKVVTVVTELAEEGMENSDAIQIPLSLIIEAKVLGRLENTETPIYQNVPRREQ